MADMTAEQLWSERRAFEAFAAGLGWSTMPVPYDEYFDLRTRAGWAAWKAARLSGMAAVKEDSQDES